MAAGVVRTPLGYQVLPKPGRGETDLLDAGLDLFRHHMPFLKADDQEWLLAKTELRIWRFGTEGHAG